MDGFTACLKPDEPHAYPYSSSSGLSIFSVDSNHMALIMPKEQASNTPKIHAKYHIVFSLINGVRLVEIFVLNSAAHNVKAVGGVAKHNRHKDTGNNKHHVQCHVARRCIPNR